MLFRKNEDNKLKEVNKSDFLSDKDYINHLLSVFDLNADTNSNEDNTIISFLEKYDIPNVDREKK
tara:strand:- start:317 stop:511 length:195 start_codon:yes stop_codon:yes gene_type:complete